VAGKEPTTRTVITHVRLQPDHEEEWDDAFRKRVEAAKEQRGFVSAHVCVPNEAPDERLVIGTWQSEDDWRQWHEQDEFVETRRRLERADEERGTPAWHEVVIDAHR
jgi:heme-degrading monooxygenase HmoA